MLLDANQLQFVLRHLTVHNAMRNIATYGLRGVKGTLECTLHALLTYSQLRCILTYTALQVFRREHLASLARFIMLGYIKVKYM